MDTAQDARFAAEFHADIDVEKIAEVYAEALLNAVRDEGASLDEAVEEFGSFIDLLDAQSRFAAVLSSAMIPVEEKVSLLEKTLRPQASPRFWNFLTVVANRGRLDILKPIYAATRSSLDRRYNRIPVVVTTAEKIDSDLFRALSEKLRVVVGGEPVVRSVVDPEVIGGLVVRVGDTIYDASILTQLKNVRQQMIDRSAHEIQCRRDSFRNPEGN